MEAFTELYRTRPEARVRERLAELIDLFLDRLWRPQDRCFGQFFSPRLAEHDASAVLGP